MHTGCKENLTVESDHFRMIRSLIEQAAQEGVLHRPQGLSGYSGDSLIGALQRMARYQARSGAGAYLEIGVFKGLTLLSVASVLGDTKAYGIDNFAQFDPEGHNKSTIERLWILNDIGNAALIESDYEVALQNLEAHVGHEKIGLYFVDGPHDYRSQLICLLFAQRRLSERAIIVVDDCNYPWVRRANRDFLISHPRYKLIYEAYTDRHPGNMSKEALAEARKGWWNGVNIMVVDPLDTLDSMFPPLDEARWCYENEHLINAASRPEIAPEATSFFSNLLDGRPVRAGRALMQVMRKAVASQRSQKRFPAMNTDSHGLPRERLNPSLLR